MREGELVPVAGLVLLGCALALPLEAAAWSVRRDDVHLVQGRPEHPVIAPGLRVSHEAYCSAEPVSAVVRAHRSAVLACYASALRREPALQGRVTVHWRVDGRGRVSEIEIEPTSDGDGVFHACIVAEIRSWQFPPPDGEAEVTFPFLFNRP